MQKKRKLSKSKIIGCVLLVASFVMITCLGMQVYRIYERSLELKLANQELEELTRQCEIVAEELALLDDEDYITRYARKNWIFTKEGETVIPLPDDAVSGK